MTDVAEPPIVDHDPVVDEVMGAWATSLGRDLPAYRGHVYRVLNLARALRGASAPVDDASLAVAVAFHDLGIWSDGTLDYLEPSAARARTWLEAHGRAGAVPMVETMITCHHRLRPCRGAHAGEAEALRRADLVDLTFGAVRFGVPAPFVRRLRAAFPNAGFHACLARTIGRWALRHPLRPLPMMRL